MASQLALTPTTNRGLLEVGLPAAGVALTLGRDRTTRIVASKCSRKQLELTVAPSGDSVRVTALKGGELPAVCPSVNGKLLRAGESRDLHLSGLLRFIHADSDTEYKLVRNTSPQPCSRDPPIPGSMDVDGHAADGAGPADAPDSAWHPPSQARSGSVEVQQPKPKAFQIGSGFGSGAGPAVAAPKAGGGGGGGGGGGRGGWFTALNDYVNHPERHRDDIVHSDDQCTVIKDKFPKSTVHLLVLSNKFIADLLKLTPADIPLFRHMLGVADEMIAKETAKDPKLVFRVGLHAIPSMERLHVHVVSQDFQSPCLKNKKHWNSFASEFFLPATGVLSQLETTGRVTVDKPRFEAILKQDLKCHHCGERLANMPKLKAHIETCSG